MSTSATRSCSKIGTLKSTWRVVGMVQGVLSGPFAYANYPYVSRVIRTSAAPSRYRW